MPFELGNKELDGPLKWTVGTIFISLIILYVIFRIAKPTSESEEEPEQFANIADSNDAKCAIQKPLEVYFTPKNNQEVSVSEFKQLCDKGLLSIHPFIIEYMKNNPQATPKEKAETTSLLRLKNRLPDPDNSICKLPIGNFQQCFDSETAVNREDNIYHGGNPRIQKEAAIEHWAMGYMNKSDNPANQPKLAKLSAANNTGFLYDKDKDTGITIQGDLHDRIRLKTFNYNEVRDLHCALVEDSGNQKNMPPFIAYDINKNLAVKGRPAIVQVQEKGDFKDTRLSRKQVADTFQYEDYVKESENKHYLKVKSKALRVFSRVRKLCGTRDEYSMKSLGESVELRFPEDFVIRKNLQDKESYLTGNLEQLRKEVDQFTEKRKNVREELKELRRNDTYVQDEIAKITKRRDEIRLDLEKRTATLMDKMGESRPAHLMGLTLMNEMAGMNEERSYFTKEPIFFPSVPDFLVTPAPEGPYRVFASSTLDRQFVPQNFNNYHVHDTTIAHAAQQDMQIPNAPFPYLYALMGAAPANLLRENRVVSEANARGLPYKIVTGWTSKIGSGAVTSNILENGAVVTKRGEWIDVEAPRMIHPHMYRMKGLGANERVSPNVDQRPNPDAWSVCGWNDVSQQWELLDSQIGQSRTIYGARKDYPVTSQKSYKRFRLIITAPAAGVNLAEFRIGGIMMPRITNELTQDGVSPDPLEEPRVVSNFGNFIGTNASTEYAFGLKAARNAFWWSSPNFTVNDGTPDFKYACDPSGQRNGVPCRFTIQTSTQQTTTYAGEFAIFNMYIPSKINGYRMSAPDNSYKAPGMLNLPLDLHLHMPSAWTVLGYDVINAKITVLDQQTNVTWNPMETKFFKVTAESNSVFSALAFIVTGAKTPAFVLKDVSFLTTPIYELPSYLLAWSEDANLTQTPMDYFRVSDMNATTASTIPVSGSIPGASIQMYPFTLKQRAFTNYSTNSAYAEFYGLMKLDKGTYTFTGSSTCPFNLFFRKYSEPVLKVSRGTTSSSEKVSIDTASTNTSIPVEIPRKGKYLFLLRIALPNDASLAQEKLHMVRLFFKKNEEQLQEINADSFFVPPNFFKHLVKKRFVENNKTYLGDLLLQWKNDQIKNMKNDSKSGQLLLELEELEERLAEISADDTFKENKMKELADIIAEHTAKIVAIKTEIEAIEETITNTVNNAIRNGKATIEGSNPSLAEKIVKEPNMLSADGPERAYVFVQVKP